jgi:hypothetical protein
MNTDRLFQFFGATFHEDWLTESSDSKAAVLRFRSNDPDEALLAANDIEEVLRTYAEEQKVADLLLHELGCYFYAPAEGHSYRSWLVDVARWLRGEPSASLRDP